jgi:hypothetical protein
MRITPLVNHACARLPQIIDVFSDVLTADIVATPGSTTDITCQTPHGQTVGSKIGICVRRAKSQVKIIEAILGSDNTVELVFNAQHGLSGNATALGVNSWNSQIELIGFTDPLMNATQEFIAKLDDKRCLIKVPESVSTELTVNAAMLDDRNDFLNGWHPVDVIDPTILRMPTHAAINTLTNASDVSIAFNIRAWGAIDYQEVKELYTNEQTQLREASLTISPLGVIPLSKDRSAKTSASAELNSSTVIRQMMLDGFHVAVTIPTTGTRAGMAAIDLCHGEILDAMLRTFQGYKPPQPDLVGVLPFAAVLKQHGGMSFDRAFYAHEYQFEAPYNLNNFNSMKSTEQTASAQFEALDPSEVQSAQPIGSSPLSEVHFDGIFNGELGQPLTASIQYED